MLNIVILQTKHINWIEIWIPGEEEGGASTERGALGNPNPISNKAYMDWIRLSWLQNLFDIEKSMAAWLFNYKENYQKGAKKNGQVNILENGVYCKFPFRRIFLYDLLL